MNEPFERDPEKESLRTRIIGLGKNSIRKNYYPQLQQRLEEAEYARNELAKSEARYRYLMENISDVILSFTKGGKITYISPTIESLSGWKPEQLQDQNFGNFIHPDDQENICICIKNPNHESFSTEIRLRHSDGRYVDVRISCHRGKNSEETTGIISDITEIKRAHREHEKLQEQLLRSQKMDSIGRLAGGVAHDFNNMLAVIMGNAELMIQQIPEGNILQDDAREILRTTQRATELTKQLLAFARKQSVKPEIINLNAAVENSSKMLRRLLGENIDLAWMPGKTPMTTLIDPSQPDQILTNLCINARDAIDGAGLISIETRTIELDEQYCVNHPGESLPGKFVILTVSDTGCGMDKRTLSNIFEPFFTTKESGKGTGLGLSTVYGIVKQNGGFITVYSEPGRGTTFNIHLPYHAEDATACKSTASHGITERGDETILLVEDEPLLLKMTHRILEDLGYRVIPAKNPTEALQAADRYDAPIDLLLTDIVMPQMDGTDLAKALAEKRPDTKHLFMSGYSDIAAARHGIIEPGSQLLQKPFSTKVLAAKIRRILESPTP
ncbi:MAG: response regulator [Pontiellaceae bacterium]|nr:response regulator [Pontiellaceae bacterium]